MSRWTDFIEETHVCDTEENGKKPCENGVACSVCDTGWVREQYKKWCETSRAYPVEKCSKCDMCVLVTRTVSYAPLDHVNQYYQCVAGMEQECLGGKDMNKWK